MNPRNEIRDLGNQMDDGENLRTWCPFCRAQEKSLSITRGGFAIKYMCFRATCDNKGTIMTAVTPSSDAPKKTLAAKRKDFLSKLTQIPQKIVTQLEDKYDIKQWDLSKNSWRWAPDEDENKGRLYIPIVSAYGKTIGAVLRSLEKTVVPKARTYLEDASAPAMSCYETHGVYLSQTVVMVEDPFSALRVARHSRRTICLLGVDFDEFKANVVRNFAGLTPVMWLDPDAFGKAMAYKAKYKPVLPEMKIIKSSVDPKDMDDQDIAKMLKSVL